MKATLLTAFLFSSAVYAAPVEFKVENVKATTGAIYFQMFDNPGAWDAETPSFVFTINSVTMDSAVYKGDLAPGEYAFFVYHDVDGDGSLKQNAFGLPVEPYAFSNNVKLGFSKPEYSKMKFTVDANGAMQTVQLN